MALGQAVLGDAYVNIMGETSQLQSSFAQAQRMAEGAVGNIGKMIAVGLGAAVAGIGGFLVYGLKQWMGKEVVINDMAAALRLSGDAAKSSAEALVEFSDQIQRTTTLSNEEVLSLMKMGLAFGVGSEKIRDVTKAAIGLGERIGAGPRTGIMLLNRAMQGNMQMFSRYGLTIDKTKSKADQLKQVMKFGGEGFVLAEQKANTLVGRLKQLQNAFGDFAAQFGKRIADAFGLKFFAEEAARVFDKVGSALGNIFGKEKGKSAFADQIKWFGQTLEAVIVRFTAMLLAMPTILAEIGKWLKSLWDAPSRLMALMVDVGKAFGEALMRSVLAVGEALREIFISIGPVLGYSLMDALKDVPILGGQIKKWAVEQMQSTMTPQQIAAMYNRSGIQHVGAAQTTRDMAEGLAFFGTWFKEKGAGAYGMASSSAAGTMTDLLVGLEEIGVTLGQEVKGALSASGLDVDAIASAYEKQLALVQKGMAMQPGAADLKGRGRERANEVKAAFESTSFAGFWSKMMSEATKKKDEDAAATAKNTGETVNLLSQMKNQGGVFA